MVDCDAGCQIDSAVESRIDTVLRAGSDLVEGPWPTLVPASEEPPSGGDGPARRLRRLGEALTRFAAALLLAASIAVVVLVAVWAGDRQLGTLDVGDLAVIGILSFLPGWLYVRFIGQRAGAVWDEFVLNLHRLGLDDPQYLPRPPENSVYYHRWRIRGGATLCQRQNIYRQKFEAYYGRSVPTAGQESRVKTETLFPVVLATVTFAIGWTALLWNGAFTDAPGTALEVMAFGFLGAYLFDIQMLIRRFFQSDLKPSAYASAVLRVVVVLIIVLVMHQLPYFADGSRASEEAVVAFVVGLFPLVGLQALNRLVTVILRGVVPTLRNRYPLSDLEGLNIWYEARLLEEGIEDMQNLVSSNMVEVLLHTRVPVGRLVDWHDQALLYLRLRPQKEKERGKHPRDALAAIGVRSATTFLRSFPIMSVAEGGGWADPRAELALKALARRSNELGGDEVMTIVRTLVDEPALGPVRSWQAWRSPVVRDRALAAPAPHPAPAPPPASSEPAA